MLINKFRLSKWLWRILAGLVLLGIALAVALPLCFNPDGYRAQIIEWVKVNKHRQLEIGEPITLSLFPNIGVRLGKVALSEVNSTEPFAQAQSVRIALKWWPLLQGKIKAGKITVTSLVANLQRDAQGQLNIADLLHSKQAGPSFDALTLYQAKLSLEDEATKSLLVLDPLNLDLSDLSDNTFTHIKLNASVNQAALRAHLDLTGAFHLDPANQRLALREIKLSVDPIQDQAFSLKLAIPALEGTFKQLEAKRLEIVFENNQAKQNIVLNITSPLSANLAQKSWTLPHLLAEGRLTMEGVSSPIPLRFEGKLAGDFTQPLFDLSGQGVFDQTHFQGALSTPGGRPSHVQFKLDADQLDLNRYAKFPSDQVDTPLNFTWLNQLTAHGNLSIRQLIIGKIHLADAQAGIQLEPGRLLVNPLTTHIFKGISSGWLSVESSAPNKIRLAQQFQAIEIGELLEAFMDQRKLDGRANLTLALALEGNTPNELRQSASGEGYLVLHDGKLNGMNPAGALKRAHTQLKPNQAQPAIAEEAHAKSSFNQFSTHFSLGNGLLNTPDLAVESSTFHIEGKGILSLMQKQLDYDLQVRLLANSDRPTSPFLQRLHQATIPVHIGGTLLAPDYLIDFRSVLNQLRPEQPLPAGPGLRDRMRNWFGRR